MEINIIIFKALSRLFGNIVKTLSYPFHFIFPKKRFTIPKYSPAKITNNCRSYKIPKIIWQTNYTNKVTLPVYVNYLFNRLMSKDYDYYYADDNDRIALIKEFGTEREYNAFMKLTDGATQADFWRVFILRLKGGVYMDIDAQLVYSLNKLIKAEDSELFIQRRPNEYTNYFIATTPDHYLLEKTLTKIVSNIEQNYTKEGVWHLTGPGVLNAVIGDTPLNYRPSKTTCIQGTFTNEYFQYMDKKRSKWIHKSNDELLKKD